MLDSLGFPESPFSSAAVGGGLFERQDSARVALLGGQQSQSLPERPVEKETRRLWHFAAGAAAWRTA